MLHHNFIEDQAKDLINTYNLNINNDQYRNLKRLLLQFGYYSISNFLNTHNSISNIDDLTKEYYLYLDNYYLLSTGLLKFEYTLKSILYNNLLLEIDDSNYKSYCFKMINNKHIYSTHKKYINLINNIKIYLTNYSLEETISHLTLYEVLILIECLTDNSKLRMLKSLHYFKMDLQSKNISIFIVRFKQLIKIRNRIMHCNNIDDYLNPKNYQYHIIINAILSFV